MYGTKWFVLLFVAFTISEISTEIVSGRVKAYEKSLKEPKSESSNDVDQISKHFVANRIKEYENLLKKSNERQERPILTKKKNQSKPSPGLQKQTIVETKTESTKTESKPQSNKSTSKSVQSMAAQPQPGKLTQSNVEKKLSPPKSHVDSKKQPINPTPQSVESKPIQPQPQLAKLAQTPIVQTEQTIPKSTLSKSNDIRDQIRRKEEAAIRKRGENEPDYLSEDKLFYYDYQILYGLRMQERVGDCNTPRPKPYRELRKWQAWNDNKGMSKDEAHELFMRWAREVSTPQLNSGQTVLKNSPIKSINEIYEIDDIRGELLRKALGAIQKRLKSEPDFLDEDKLSYYDYQILYGLGMQETQGDCNTPRPKSYRDIRKWEAWNDNKGMSKEEARELFIRWVRELP